MNIPDYEYHGLLASTWDLGRGDTSNWADRLFYREIVQHYGQPVLDVGCGTGRILLDYLSDGIAIEGVDNSPEMLALCREKARQSGLTPNLYQQTMEELDLPHSYRTILVPSSSFQLLTDAAIAQQALLRFYAHLQPGGALVMSFFIGRKQGDPLESDWALAFEKERSEEGTTVRRWARDRFDLANQLSHSEDRFEIVRNGEVIESEHHQRSPSVRWYSQEQAAQLYQDAGFTPVQLFHEFTQEPASPEDTLFCVLGVKP